MSISPSQSTALLISATKGFDHLFANDIVSSRDVFKDKDDPYHLLGLGVCAFLEAALAMEAPLMTEATRCLALAEAGSRKQAKASRAHVHRNKLSGLEWDILNADAVVLLGMTQALSESYMGYLQCMYSLNSAHSKFTKLYKTVFPNGLEGLTTTTTAAPPSSSALLPLHLPPPPISSSSSSSTSSSPGPSLPASPAASAPVSATSSVTSLSLPSEGTLTPPSPSPTSPTSPSKPSSLHPPPRPPLPPSSPSKRSFLGRLIGSATTPPSASTPVLQTEKDHAHAQLTAEEQEEEEGPVSELVIAGTAFGFGLFNLVFSLLPKKVQSLVGFLGFKHDRKLALQALSVAAGKKDVHGVFSGLVLMTYHGVVLLMSGYQADEVRIVAQYEAIVKDLEGRYPTGALWILNRAKVLRMTGKGEEAIQVLEKGLEPERVHSFKEADMVLVFELAWTLLAHRRYVEAADMFIKITDLNSWSHATYFFIASGCHFSLGNKAKAQELLDRTWEMFQDTKKIGGKELPTEVFIKKKVTFYKEKQARRGGDPARYVDAIMISPAEEMSIFWNNHARVDASIALERCAELVVLTPLPTIQIPSPTPLRSSPSTPTSASSSVPNSASIPSPAGTSPSSVPSTTIPDLDTPDELAIRSLLLGINYRTASAFPESRLFLTDAYQHQSSIKVSTWIGGVAMFELAVLDLKEAQAAEEGERLRGGSEKEEFASRQELRSVEEEEEKKEEGMLEMWRNALRSAAEKLDVAAGAGLSGSSVDLSSRLDTRIAMLRDEIALKKEMLGI